MAITQGQLSATATAILTVAAGAKPQLVTNDWWYNTDAATAYGIDVHVVKAGGTAAATNQIAQNTGVSISAYSSSELDIKGLRLDVGDAIYAKSTTANIITYTIAHRDD